MVKHSIGVNVKELHRVTSSYRNCDVIKQREKRDVAHLILQVGNMRLTALPRVGAMVEGVAEKDYVIVNIEESAVTEYARPTVSRKKRKSYQLRALVLPVFSTHHSCSREKFSAIRSDRRLSMLVASCKFVHANDCCSVCPVMMVAIAAIITIVFQVIQKNSITGSQIVGATLRYCSNTSNIDAFNQPIFVSFSDLCNSTNNGATIDVNYFQAKFGDYKLALAAKQSSNPYPWPCVQWLDNDFISKPGPYAQVAGSGNRDS